jgi:4-hydroxyphenylpyruvate dioxygenase
MVDADEEGYLLQILQNQYKTDLFFFEIIQRMDQRFGAGNFKALFEYRERAGIMRNSIKFFLHYVKI